MDSWVGLRSSAWIVLGRLFICGRLSRWPHLLSFPHVHPFLRGIQLLALHNLDFQKRWMEEALLGGRIRLCWLGLGLRWLGLSWIGEAS